MAGGGGGGIGTNATEDDTGTDHDSAILPISIIQNTDIGILQNTDIVLIQNTDTCIQTLLNSAAPFVLTHF